MRIALSGSHSVGKSTLLQHLSLPGHRKIQEQARDEINRRGRLPHEMDHQEFLEFHLSLVSQQAEAEQGDFIVDRSIFDMVAYAMDHQSHHQVLTLARQHYRPYDHVFYLPIEFGLSLDEVRKNDLEYQQIIDRRLLQIFDDLNIAITVVGGNLESRLAKIYQALNYAKENQEK
jgi:predicted ATPase